MRDSLGLTVVLYGLGLALVTAGFAVVGGERAGMVTGSLVVLEGVTVLQGLLDAVALVGGDHGPAVATNLGYLVTSIIVLPAAGGAAGMDTRRWGNVAAAVACLLVAIISLRLHTTLGQSRA